MLGVSQLQHSRWLFVLRDVYLDLVAEVLPQRGDVRTVLVLGKVSEAHLALWHQRLVHFMGFEVGVDS